MVVETSRGGGTGRRDGLKIWGHVFAAVRLGSPYRFNEHCMASTRPPMSASIRLGCCQNCCQKALKGYTVALRLASPR